MSQDHSSRLQSQADDIAEALVKKLQDLDWDTWSQLDDAMSFEGDGMKGEFAKIIVGHLREE